MRLNEISMYVCTHIYKYICTYICTYTPIEAEIKRNQSKYNKTAGRMLMCIAKR